MKSSHSYQRRTPLNDSSAILTAKLQRGGWLTRAVLRWLG